MAENLNKINLDSQGDPVLKPKEGGNKEKRNKLKKRSTH
jgi:hypothetical protein